MTTSPYRALPSVDRLLADPCLAAGRLAWRSWPLPTALSADRQARASG